MGSVRRMGQNTSGRPAAPSTTTTATLPNRYRVDDTLGLPSARASTNTRAVFAGGDADASDPIPGLPSMHQTAQVAANSALLILWEHRPYGASSPAQPANMLLGDLAAFYRFYTFDQALEEVALFARNFAWGLHM